MPQLNDAVIVAIMSALGGFLVALLNRRSSLEGEQTKRLEILISSQQDAFDRQAQTLTSLEADMIKLRAEWAAERESHHHTKVELEKAKLYHTYVAAEVGRVGRWLNSQDLTWPPPDFLTFPEWWDTRPRDEPRD